MEIGYNSNLFQQNTHRAVEQLDSVKKISGEYQTKRIVSEIFQMNFLEAVLGKN